MVKAPFDANIFVNYLNAASPPTILASGCSQIVSYRNDE
jgi:hypothetical protein